MPCVKLASNTGTLKCLINAALIGQVDLFPATRTLAHAKLPIYVIPHRMHPPESISEASTRLTDDVSNRGRFRYVIMNSIGVGARFLLDLWAWRRSVPTRYKKKLTPH
jgi:hypothetical protein